MLTHKKTHVNPFNEIFFTLSNIFLSGVFHAIISVRLERQWLFQGSLSSVNRPTSLFIMTVSINKQTAIEKAKTESLKTKFKAAAIDYEKKDGIGSFGSALAWAFYNVLCEGYRLTDLDELRDCPIYTGKLPKSIIHEKGLPNCSTSQD